MSGACGELGSTGARPGGETATSWAGALGRREEPSGRRRGASSGAAPRATARAPHRHRGRAGREEHRAGRRRSRSSVPAPPALRPRRRGPARPGRRRAVGDARRRRGRLEAAGARRARLGADAGHQRHTAGRARLRRRSADHRAASADGRPAQAAGLPRGLATALTVVARRSSLMGLVGWFVVWQVMENLRHPLRPGPGRYPGAQALAAEQPVPCDGQADQRHRTEPERHGRRQHERDHIGGLRASRSWSRSSPACCSTMFSTLFLLYDGARIWQWVLKMVPAQARQGVAGAGPRAWQTLTAYVRGTVIVALIDAVFIGARDLLPGCPDGGAAGRLHLPVRVHPAGGRGDVRARSRWSSRW